MDGPVGTADFIQDAAEILKNTGDSYLIIVKQKDGAVCRIWYDQDEGYDRLMAMVGHAAGYIEDMKGGQCLGNA
jgi:hypothetical protein